VLAEEEARPEAVTRRCGLPLQPAAQAAPAASRHAPVVRRSGRLPLPAATAVPALAARHGRPVVRRSGRLSLSRDAQAAPAGLAARCGRFVGRRSGLLPLPPDARMAAARPGVAQRSSRIRPAPLAGMAVRATAAQPGPAVQPEGPARPGPVAAAPAARPSGRAPAAPAGMASPVADRRGCATGRPCQHSPPVPAAKPAREVPRCDPVAARRSSRLPQARAGRPVPAAAARRRPGCAARNSSPRPAPPAGRWLPAAARRQRPAARGQRRPVVRCGKVRAE
jgi:hypothetical protein